MTTPATFDLTGANAIYRGDDESISIVVKEPRAATIEAAWATATPYVVADEVEAADGYVYVAIAAHTSAAASEPGVGGTWATYWEQATDPVNITGRTYTAQIRATTALTAPILASWTCAITDGPNGGLTCSLASEDSADLVATPTGRSSSAVWDLQEDNGGVITTLLAGKVKITGDVTRP